MARANQIIMFLSCLALTSCTSITLKLQESENCGMSSYPCVPAQDPDLAKGAIVNLDKYKSVHGRFRERASIAVALAASGGGYRAANLTLGVLLGLEKLKSASMKGNMLQEIDYISSVSGSGFGIGYYLTQLHNYLYSHRDSLSFSLANAVNTMFAHDCYQANPLRADLTEFLFFGTDRGLQIEKTLNATLLNTPEGGLSGNDIFVPKNSPCPVRLPFWAINATIFQNAQIFPFTPDVLATYRVVRFNHNGMSFAIPGNFSDPTYAYGVPLSVGLTASMSVPFALPATTLTSIAGCEGESYLQLFDGGLSDNLGVYTAIRLLLADKSKVKVLIIADAYKGNAQPFSKIKKSPSGISLAVRTLTMGTDSNRERIKSSINLVARDLLCRKGTTNVIVVYMDLQKYPEAQQISTRLTMPLEQQKALINIGQKLVADNETLQQFISQVPSHHLTLGQCK